MKLNESFLLVIRDISRRITAQCSSLGSVRTGCCKLRKDVLSYWQQYLMKLRDAASHLLLFMIANEKRDSKAYSILVRALPFSSFSDDSVRKLSNELDDINC